MSRTSSADLLFSTEPFGRRAVRFALILAAHAAVLWAGFELASRPEVRQAAQEIYVRLVEPQRPPPPEPQIKPPSEPVKPQPTRRAPVPDPPQPVMTAKTDTPAPAPSFAVPPQPPAPTVAPPIEAAPPPVPAAPVPVTPARFDADYLANPKPAYPVASRRLGEEGKVVLRVKVSPGGTPAAVEVKQSSGFARLDEAAKSAVEHWRFVPARRGDEAVESWVSVPIVFSLQGS